MRQCPFTGCNRQISRDKFACLTHWKNLSRLQQAKIWNAYGRYLNSEIGMEELAAIQRTIVDEAESGLFYGTSRIFNVE